MSRKVIAAAENEEWSFESHEGVLQYWFDGMCAKQGSAEDIERYIRAKANDLEAEADLHRDALDAFKSATEEPSKCPEF